MSVLGKFILGTDKLGGAFFKTKKWQDIQINDRTAWENIKRMWNAGNYSQAIAALQATSLQYKWNDAIHINQLFASIDAVREESKESRFKDMAPITSDSAPVNPSVNRIWFDIV